MSAWESETAHRRDLERKQLRYSVVDSIFGKSCALIFVLASLGLSGYAASIGAEWLGIVPGGGVIASVVWAFTNAPKAK